MRLVRSILRPGLSLASEGPQELDELQSRLRQFQAKSGGRYRISYEGRLVLWASRVGGKVEQLYDDRCSSAER